ncbi:MAG: 50S ribosomal protein L3 [Candidatus Methanomethylophilaceae archaeon]|jgi:large subunit ribosomal protein L3|nr:50S ribosomal protein L3 [Candidatus Methanomethylophilaceae archaeon]NCA73701.1 50S ribosomal protein L3 [Gammaproteobacteria bacterium]MDD3351344.1 50S ribosomal protein L3 [Candidatus Methanomethylophilaceae archaeon]MDD3986716.1 50S ribosomal protein L3 [Candidatus Methanomethylophilaceae archaeon]MDD4709129.1 50S ribosomal protein L3 [Candidatus Methanomethylophilaceae archaeon]
MSQRRRPKRGSRAYGPRKRAQAQRPRLDSWPEVGGSPKIQGFAGYKAGMTHAFIVDKRVKSTTSGMEVQTPVTVIEVPPMKIAAVRFYENSTLGLKTAGEVWANDLDPLLERKMRVPKEHTAESFARYDGLDTEDIRVLAYTQPKLVSGVPKKVPELMELRIGGGTIAERLAYAKGILGKEMTVTDFAPEGAFVDVIAITKGKGFQGATKRWGVKLLSHRNSKHRRMIGNLGPKRPGYVRGTVPMSGQMGYHQRTEFNKKIVKVGEEGAEINPKGGFLNYGEVRNTYILVRGSVPGPTKRIIRLRDATRLPKKADTGVPEITYVSTESKQGA